MSGNSALRVAAQTDVGRVRERNEDSYYTGTSVFAVADGLGGHRAGEVASSAALEALEELDTKPSAVAARELAAGVRRGNRTVYERAQQDPELRGMGTTMTAVAIHGGAAHVAHVGDSRFYLIRDGAISQVTEDHTVVARMVAEGRLTPEQAESHPQRSLLLRALGAEDQVDVDETQVPLKEGDRLLLCSDGLYAVVADEDILEMSSGAPDLDEVCRNLVDAANSRGGPDNITVVLVEVGGAALAGGDGEEGAVPATVRRSPAPRTRPARRMHSRVRARWVITALVVVVAVLGGFFVLRSIVNNNYFVGVDDGRVAIFRGVPAGGLRGLSSVEERPSPPIEVSSLDPADRRKLEEGIRVPSISEARLTVARFRERQLTPEERAAIAEASP